MGLLFVHSASLERVAEDHEVIPTLLVTASDLRGRGICVVQNHGGVGYKLLQK